MTSPRILVSHPIHPEVHARLAAAGEVVVNSDIEPWSYEELVARLRDADALMGFMTDRVDAAALADARRLKIVACALKGHDSYDIEACTRAGVWVSAVPDLLTAPTAELAVGLAIALGRQLRAGDAHVRSGAFAGWRTRFYGSGLAGSVVAVLGLGQVGAAIVERLQGFGCARVLGVDAAARHPRAEPVPLADALRQADYLFLAAPLLPGTLRLIDRLALAGAKPGQLIVNVGRGSVVDEDALADALHAGRIGGYAADVFAMEDWALPGRPRTIPQRLLEHPDTVLTPHIGSAVRSVRLAIEHSAADNILSVLAGEAPPDAVNQPEPARAELIASL